MSVLEDLAGPPVFIDRVPVIAVTEGVYLITFAAPIGEDMTALDAAMEPPAFGGGIVASLALSKAAAMSLASRLSLVITRQDVLDHYRADAAAQTAAQRRN